MKVLDNTALQVMLRLAAVIAAAGLFIKFALQMSQTLNIGAVEIFIEVALLFTLLTPVIYFLIISPLIQERDIAIRELADMADTDKLTGLSKPRVFQKCTDKVLAECARHHIHAALILIDIDDFSAINERYGRKSGDAVLVEIGRRLLNGVRTEDVVSRVGDDEFMILIKQLNENRDKATEEVLAFAEKIKNSLLLPIEYEDKILHISSSLGVNLITSETDKIEEEIRKVDDAMNYARRQGKGHVVIYDPGMVSRNRNWS